MRYELWVIESRNADGSLYFGDPQPESVFGIKAITGINEDAMAKTVYQNVGADVALRGDQIASWPSLIHWRWVARRKTW